MISRCRSLVGALVGLFLFAGCSSSDSNPAVPSDMPDADASADVSAEGDAPTGEERVETPDVAAEDDAQGDSSDAGSSDVADSAETSDSSCGPCPSGICLDGSVCAECAPGPTDNCPSGQYCTDAFTCVAGCKNNDACASGVCNGTTHDCDQCIADTECAGGRLCGSGVCEATCAGLGTCAGGLECCSQRCVDRSRDIAHCGGCDTACPLDQFCGSTGCTGVSFANICSNAKTTAIFDGLAADDASNRVLQAALVASCPAPPAASSVAPGDPGPINAKTGQPVAGGGNLLTAAGGFVVHKLVGYVESSAGSAPIHLVYTNTEWQYQSRASASDAGDGGGGTVIASIPFTEVTSTHDIFLAEMVRDASSGTLVVLVYGQSAASTAAAAWYFANEMVPNRANYDKSWYVYEWTGTSDAGPTGSDSFQLRASGP